MRAKYDYRPRFDPTLLVIGIGIALALVLGWAFTASTSLPHAHQEPAVAVPHHG